MFSMGMSLNCSFKQQMICSLCDEPMEVHTASCPQGKLEVLVNGTVHYQCPICSKMRLTINEDDFKLFVFENCAEMHAQMNPDFYKGTVVEDAVSKVMAGKKSPGAAASAAE